MEKLQATSNHYAQLLEELSNAVGHEQAQNIHASVTCTRCLRNDLCCVGWGH